MWTHRNKRVGSIPMAAGLALVLMLVVSGSAEARLRVTAVSLEADPKIYEGPCPVTIKFKGKITANMGGMVRYKFTRSDGATSPVRTLSMGGGGGFGVLGESITEEVRTTWRLGGPGMTYAGWQKLKILSPNTMQSSKARFKIRCTNRQRPGVRPRGKPDLVVRIAGPGGANAGDDIGSAIGVKARNIGTGPAPGTIGALDPSNGYMIDVVLSTDTSVPSGYATYSANFSEDVLLLGGRISRTDDLAPGAIKAYATGGGIPADTPTGRYYLCARIDSGNKVAELSEGNNVSCTRIKIKGKRQRLEQKKR